jgi:hypothetical protein
VFTASVVSAGSTLPTKFHGTWCWVPDQSQGDESVYERAIKPISWGSRHSRMECIESLLIISANKTAGQDGRDGTGVVCKILRATSITPDAYIIKTKCNYGETAEERLTIEGKNKLIVKMKKQSMKQKYEERMRHARELATLPLTQEESLARLR